MRELPIASGAILTPHAASVAVGDDWFELPAAGRTARPNAGRGAAAFVELPVGRALLRHYRRGGWLAKVNRDRYLWQGADATRAFVELRLLDQMRALGLPVPEPIAARYQRSGTYYRAAILVGRIDGAESLAERIARVPGDIDWRGIGATIAGFHAAGIDHADLNAHNVLIDSAGAIWLVDFDRAERRAAGAWTAANLRRLRRSLDKLQAPLTVADFESCAWAALLAGYAHGATQ